MKKLDTIVNIVILLFLVTAGGIYARNYIIQGANRQRVKTGDKLPQLQGYSWNSHARTLVLALKSGCHFCEDSAPFYKKLVELKKTDQLGDTHILAVFPDSPAIAHNVLQAEGLDVPFISPAPFKDLKIPVTPTAVLVDREGRVARVWFGELPSSQERRLLDSISSPLGASPADVSAAEAGNRPPLRR